MQKARYVAALGIPLSALLSFTLVAAWTGPTQSPPNGNIAAPVNVGSFGVNALAVFGNSLFGGSTGSNAYLNFGATGGTNGYGIRDNNGLLEFKNRGGSWASIQSTVFNLVGGSASWTSSGNNISNTNTGNVGIGIDPSTVPDNIPLQVKSSSGNYAIFSDWVNNTLRIGGDGLGNMKLYSDTESQGIRLVPAWSSDSGIAGLMVSGIGKVYIGTIYDAVYNAQLTIVEERGHDSPINLKVAGTYPHSQIIFQNDWGLIGNITTAGAGTAYNTSSDRRIKENIATTTAGLSTLLKIPVNDFNFATDRNKTRVQGFIAQDLYKYYPEAVTVGGEDARAQPWQVDYGRLTPLIVKAVQEQQAEIESQNAEIQSLKSDNAALKRGIEELRSALRTK